MSYVPFAIIYYEGHMVSRTWRNCERREEWWLPPNPNPGHQKTSHMQVINTEDSTYEPRTRPSVWPEYCTNAD